MRPFVQRGSNSWLMATVALGIAFGALVSDNFLSAKNIQDVLTKELHGTASVNGDTYETDQGPRPDTNLEALSQDLMERRRDEVLDLIRA